MSMRALAITALAFVLLVAVALIGQRSPDDASRSDTLFAPGLGARFDDIESIVVRKAGDEIVATLNQVEKGWVVAERSGYPADTSKIRAALVAISDARIVEAKTSNPELYERLGLGDLTSEDSRAVSLTLLPESPSTPTMIFGDSEGTSYRYARLEGDPQTVLISADPELPTDTADWLLPQILDVRGDRIERIVISHADGERLELYKNEVGQSNFEVADIPEGRALQYPGVANVTGNVLRDLRFEDVAILGDSPAPEVTAEFTTFDGLVVRAEGFTIDGDGWLRFTARQDTEFTDSDPESDAATEAAAINRIVEGWRYRIASYQYDQLTRRVEDLLRAEDSTN